MSDLRQLFSQRPPKITATVCAVAVVLMCTGCKETNRQVFKRYDAQFAQKREQFKKIAQELPPKGSVQGPTSANLSPKPVYDVKSGTYNTEIVMYDQLLDPDIKSEGHNRLDLLLSEELLRGIKWTGPNSAMSPSDLDRSAVPDLDPSLKKAVGYRYLVVLRPVNYVAPIATDETTFKPGIADVEGFTVDMDNNKVVGSFRFSAKSDPKVEYSYKKGQNQQERLEEFAHSSLYTDARQKLRPLLEQTTGGQFVFDR